MKSGAGKDAIRWWRQGWPGSTGEKRIIAMPVTRAFVNGNQYTDDTVPSGRRMLRSRWDGIDRTAQAGRSADESGNQDHFPDGLTRLQRLLGLPRFGQRERLGDRDQPAFSHLP